MPVISSRFIEGCISMKNFSVPDSVRTLGDGAFLGYSDLDEVILLEGLMYMGKVFEGCGNTWKRKGIERDILQLYGDWNP